MSQGISETPYRDINAIDEASADYIVVRRGDSYLGRATYVPSHTFSDTDILTVLEDVIDELPASYLGKILVKLRGVHLMSDTLLLDAKPQLEIGGLGWGTELRGNGAYPVIHVDTQHSIFLQKMILSQNPLVASECLRVQSAINFKAHEVWCYGGATNLRIMGSAATPIHADFQKCKCSDGGYGIQAEGWIDYVRFTETMSVANTIRGMHLDTLHGGVVEAIGLNMQNPAAPIGLRIVNCDNNNIKLLGGGIFGGEIRGAEIGTSPAKVSMVDYDIIASVQEGLYLYEQDQFEATQLRVRECSQGGAGVDSAIVADTCEDMLIQGMANGALHLHDLEERGACNSNLYIGDFEDSVLLGANSRILKRARSSRSWNDGVDTILNGQTVVTVTHGVAGTPRVVQAMGSSGDTRDLFVTAIGANTFQIVASGAVGGNRTVYWRADL